MSELPAGSGIVAMIDGVASGRDLSFELAQEACEEIISGEVSGPRIAGLLMGMRTKGETAAEIAGFATTMRDHVVPVRPTTTELVELCGTGGGESTFNVSTTAAFVVAAAGCTVAKGGNRSSTSKSGSADVLEALGVAINLEPEHIAELIDDVGFGFMFAPNHHAAMKTVVPVRKELAVRTIFNLVGPLTNPAGAQRQLLGVGYPDSIDVMAEAAQRLGTERTLLVHSNDGLDEVSIAADSKVVEVTPDGVQEHTVSPASLGIVPGSIEGIGGALPGDNAIITLCVLGGEFQAGHPAIELVVANAGLAIYASGKADSMPAGVEMAREALSSGRAIEVYERYRARTRELRELQKAA